MTLRLLRARSHDDGTLGVLLADDDFFGFTLEDQVRELPGKPVESWKVPGETAIPAGRYQVRVSWSPKFQRNLPELLEVPGFSGIRVHGGNAPADTEGCVLVGVQRAGVAAIRGSHPIVEDLTARISAADGRGEPTFILIENPMGGGA